MAITAAELARQCGVSRGTIDRALNGRGGINAETYAKVIEMAERFGYRPNPIGQALVSGRTMTIGVILFDFDHSFFAELYAALTAQAEQFNYELLPLLSYGDPAREKECLARLATRRVDGIVLLPVNHEKAFETWLQSLAIPTVCLHNRLSSAFSFTGIDDRGAARTAVRHLAETGAKNIYYYCPPLRWLGQGNLLAQTERLSGYQEALLHNSRLRGDAATLSSTILALLRQHPDEPAAVLCSNDFHAMDLQLELRREMLDREVRLMGFDGLRILKYAQPAIASVGFDREVMAKSCFEQLQQRMAGKPAADAIIPFTIQE